MRSDFSLKTFAHTYNKFASPEFSSSNKIICTRRQTLSSENTLTSDLPTPRPLALKKVKIMPPPSRITSHFSMRDSITVICRRQRTENDPTPSTGRRVPSRVAVYCVVTRCLTRPRRLHSPCLRVAWRAKKSQGRLVSEFLEVSFFYFSCEGRA